VTPVTESISRIAAVTAGADIEQAFQHRLAEAAKDTQALLDRLLAATPLAEERARPARLLAAMRYASLGGGKRLRPFLVVESASLFGVPRQHSLMAAAALECVHCYWSTTTCQQWDGLLTFAFDILCRPQTHPDAGIRLRLVAALARAAGLGGMEGRFEGKPAVLAEEDVRTLQAMKTGALLRFACLAGAILGEADGAPWSALDRYGSALGEAFQVADDLLDVEGDPALMGKATRKDAAAHKATIVGVLGPAAARQRLEALVEEAQSALNLFGSAGGTLKAAAQFVATRRN
jgi:farnesyl diphosphate synthase